MRIPLLISCFLLAAPAPAAPGLEQYQARRITVTARLGLPYRLYVPPHSGRASLPLLILLHSISERGRDNLAPFQFFSPHLSDDFYGNFPSVIAIPQCPVYKFWWQKTPSAALAALIPGLLLEFPEIDPSRVYVLGVSLGGYQVYSMLAKMPEPFAAAVSICGDPTPAKLEPKAVKDFPLWIFHGAKDPRVPVEGDRKLAAQLRELGGSPRYTEYPDEGHRIWKQAFAEPGLWDWLFAQRQRRKVFVFECGKDRFVVQEQGKDRVWIFGPNFSKPLSAAVSASGSRYTDAETKFWSHGEEILIRHVGLEWKSCRRRHADEPWESAKLNGVSFRGLGHEPEWVLELRMEKKAQLKALGKPDLALESGTGYTIEPGPCEDSMSGEKFESRVTVLFEKRILHGCGKALH